MSMGWPNLGGALLLTLAGLLVVAGILGLLAWNARRRGSPWVLLDLAGAVARMWLVLVMLGGAVTVVRWFVAGDAWIPDLPVSMPWPTALPCEAANPGDPTAAATLFCAHVSSADATITGLDFGTTALLAGGDLLGTVAAALPALLIAVLCAKAAKGMPFTRAASTWLFAGAIAILVAGFGASILTGAGQALAAAAVLPPPGGGPVTTTGIYRLDVPLWPIGAALALGALGAVFRHGAVLQRETEGLV